MPRITPLCSSSKGNCTYIGDSDNGILIDAGCSLKMLRDSLVLCGLDLSAVKAIFITHEHSDHIGALKMLTKYTTIPIYATPGTINYLISHGCVSSQAYLYDISEIPNAPTDMEITPFKTPHDSAESTGYTIRHKNHKIGFCTDLGEVTPTVRENILGSEVVLVEANYQPEMLKNNPNYPEFLKQRIASSHGHLSNPDSADFVNEMVESGTTRVILGHLSESNNTPKTAYSCVSNHLYRNGIKVNTDCTLDVAEVRTSGINIVF